MNVKITRIFRKNNNMKYFTGLKFHNSAIYIMLFFAVSISACLSPLPGKYDNRTAKLKGIKVLVYTRNGEGYVHTSIPAGVKAFELLSEKNDFSIDISDDSEMFTDNVLRHYHAIIFLNTNNDVFTSDDQRVALMRYVQAGGGLMGIHIATGTERNWKWFKQMIGATFDRHPPAQKFTVRVIDNSHPSVSHLPDEWIVEDEPYYVKEFNPGVRVIMINDLNTINDKNEKPEVFGNLYPSAWCNTFDGGRQWYTSLGHFDQIYSDENFLKHLLEGLKWVIVNGKPDYKKAYSQSLSDIR